MKKIYFIIFVLVTLLLSACTNDLTTGGKMTIKPSQFSKETQEVLKLFDDEILFLDYKVDETVKAYSINLWAYQNGEWIGNGATSGGFDLGDRIALRLTDNSYDLYTIDETGHTKYGINDLGTDFSVCTSIASTRLTNPTSIELNKEIPLWVKIGTDKHGISIGEIHDFRNSDCNAGVAITVTFYDKELDNSNPDRSPNV